MTSGLLRRANKSPMVLASKLLLLAVGTFFLFYSGPQYDAARSIRQLWNLGHIGYFALLILLLARMRALQQFSRLQQWIGLLLVSLALGVGIEMLQYGTMRNPDLGDVSRDMAGALLALAFHPTLSGFSRQITRRLIRAVAVVVLLLHLVPLSIAVLDETTARRQFPLLSAFDTAFEIDRWHCNATCRVIELDDGSHALDVGLKTMRYSGAGLQYFPSDWRTYQMLNLVFFNPDDAPLRITLRVHDWQHEQGTAAYASNDRFHRSYILHRGWNKISVPLRQIEYAPRTRAMDMQRIRDVSFYSYRLRQARRVLLERIYLL